MAPPKVFACILVLAITICVSSATDPNQLQDFCPTSRDPTNNLFVNGRFCKNPVNVTADDFLFEGLDVPLDTDNPFGSGLILLNGLNFSGVNTLGLAVGRVDFAQDGVVQPHSHPRGSEVFIVMEGTIYTGFVNFQNKLFTKVLNKGDVFAIPQGLLHFHHNIGKEPAYAIQAFSSQNPGANVLPNALFGTQPRISVNTLAKSFQVDADVIEVLQSKYKPPS